MVSFGKTTLAALATAVVVAGCGGTANPTNPRFYLVKTQAGYANVYWFQVGNVPGTPHAVYLGTSNADVQANLSKAAAELGVPLGNITNTTSP